MAVNKVMLNGETLLDLTSDTVTAADVAAGKWLHLPSGERVQGTGAGMSGGDMQEYIGAVLAQFPQIVCTVIPDEGTDGQLFATVTDDYPVPISSVSVKDTQAT